MKRLLLLILAALSLPTAFNAELASDSQITNRDKAGWTGGYGYGFITCVSDNVPQSGQDIYVYQTNICPSVSTFRTLVKDEYVSFDISEEERPQALNVRGVGGGPLRCDAPRPRPRQRRNNRNGNNQSNSNSNSNSENTSSETAGN